MVQNLQNVQTLQNWRFMALDLRHYSISLTLQFLSPERKLTDLMVTFTFLQRMSIVTNLSRSGSIWSFAWQICSEFHNWVEPSDIIWSKLQSRPAQSVPPDSSLQDTAFGFCLRRNLLVKKIKRAQELHGFSTCWGHASCHRPLSIPRLGHFAAYSAEQLPRASHENEKPQHHEDEGHKRGNPTKTA